jgi:hypothetical protein
MSENARPSPPPATDGPDPGPPGSDGLRVWVENYADHFRAFFREAVLRGHPPELIVISTPMADRTDRAPDNFDAIPLARSHEVTRVIPSLAGSFGTLPMSGGFYVVATRGEGRLRGSYVAFISWPRPDDVLPAIKTSLDAGGPGK